MRTSNIQGMNFEIIGVSNPTDYRCIWLTNGNPSEHHVYADNKYFGRGINTVRIVGRHGQVLGPAAYERGNFKAKYQKYVKPLSSIQTKHSTLLK